MHGSITIDNNIEWGTTTCIAIPFKLTEPPTLDHEQNIFMPPSEENNALRILIVEDEKINQIAITKLALIDGFKRWARSFDYLKT